MTRASLTLICFSAAVSIGWYLFRGWSPAAQPHKPWHRFLIYLITISGLLLRLWQVDFGLPYNFHPDEVPKVNVVANMLHTGDLNPHYFLHPSLLLYLTAGMTSIVQSLTGCEDIRSTINLSGRLVSVVFGTLTIFESYILSASIGGPVVGLVTAAILAITPLHVVTSRYLKEDALLLFFILLAIRLTLRAASKTTSLKQEYFSYGLVGVAAGFAMGAKYSAVLLLPLIGLLTIVLRPAIRVRHLITLGIVVGITALFIFVCTTPYAVFDLAAFLKGVTYEGKHALRGHTVAVSPWDHYWMYHMRRSILPGLTVLPLLFGLVGFGAGLQRRYLPMTIALLVFYISAEWVSSKPEPQPERYIVPCLPFIAFFAGIAYVRLATTKLRVGILLMTLFVPVFVCTIMQTGAISRDTRLELREWLTTQGKLKSSLVLLDHNVYSGSFAGNETVNYSYLADIGSFPALSRERLHNGGYDYLVLSSLWYERYFRQPGAPAIQRGIIRSIFERYPVAVNFSNRPGRYGFHNPDIYVFALHEPYGDKPGNLPNFVGHTNFIDWLTW